jgi:hypothetical protein
MYGTVDGAKAGPRGRFFPAGVALALFLVAAAPAYADVVHNNLSASATQALYTDVDAAVHVGYRIQATGGDGQNGCNAADGTPARLIFDMNSVVEASPVEPVINFCSSNTWTFVSFSSSVAGVYTISVSVSDPGPGSYSSSGATFTLHVQVPDTTPPVLVVPDDLTVEATGPTGAAVTFTATATDDVDGTVPVSCSPASGGTFPLGDTTVTCNASDSKGNEATASFTVTVSDTTAPVTGLTLTGPAGNGDWFVGDVLAELDCTDTVSACDATWYALDDADFEPYLAGVLLIGDGVHTFSYKSADAAGNEEAAQTATIGIDATPPVTTDGYEGIVGTLNWYRSGVTVTLSCTDATSGCAETWYQLDGGEPQLYAGSFEVTAPGLHTVKFWSVDAAGNAEPDPEGEFVIDVTPPTLSLPTSVWGAATGPAGGDVSYVVSATDDFDADPSINCSLDSGSTFPLGITTVTCTAVDLAGNEATGTFTVVVAYAWYGFRPPINEDGSSVFKLGSTVPVKFKLAGGSAGTSTAVAVLHLAKVTGAVLGSELEATSTSKADTGNLFRYDPTDDQYIYNLATKDLTAGTWRLRADLGDGIVHTVFISLRK